MNGKRIFIIGLASVMSVMALSAGEGHKLVEKEYTANKFLYNFRIRVPENSKFAEQDSGIYVYYYTEENSAQVTVHAKPGEKFSLKRARSSATMLGDAIEKEEKISSGLLLLFVKPRAYFQTIHAFARGPDGTWLMAKVSGPKTNTPVLKEMALSLKNGGYQKPRLVLKRRSYRSVFSLMVPTTAKLTDMDPNSSSVKFEHSLSFSESVSASVTHYDPDEPPMKMSELISKYEAKHVLEQKTLPGGHLFLKLKKIGYGEDQGAVMLARSPAGEYLKLEVMGPAPFAKMMTRMALSFKITGRPRVAISKWKKVSMKKGTAIFEVLVPEGSARVIYGIGDPAPDFIYNRDVGLLEQMRMQMEDVSLGTDDTFSMKWAEKKAVGYSDRKVLSRKKTSLGFLVVVDYGTDRKVNHYIKRGEKYFVLGCRGPADTLPYLRRIAESVK